MKTFFINSNYLIRKWYIIDANNKSLGRLSSEISKLLIGKYSCYNFSSKNQENFVIIINSKYILRNKYINKFFYNKNKRPGNLKKTHYKDLLNKFPEKVLYKAISNMIPKNILGKTYLKQLYIYTKNMILYYKK